MYKQSSGEFETLNSKPLLLSADIAISHPRINYIIIYGPHYVYEKNALSTSDLHPAWLDDGFMKSFKNM